MRRGRHPSSSQPSPGSGAGVAAARRNEQLLDSACCTARLTRFARRCLTILALMIAGLAVNAAAAYAAPTPCDGGGQINNSGTLTLTNCTISGVSGSGVVNTGTLTLSNVTITGNSTTVDGGGIDNEGGTVSLYNVVISNNSALYAGGGIYNYLGTVSTSNSTISDNSAHENGGGGYAGYDATFEPVSTTINGNTTLANGGGIWSNQFSSVCCATRTTYYLANDTITGNTAGDEGGGIYNAGGSVVALGNATIADNSAGFYGGGIYDTTGAFSGGTIDLHNTILANNTAGIAEGDCGGVVADSSDRQDGYNQSDDVSCAWQHSSDEAGLANLDLGQLSNNGGPSQGDPGTPAPTLTQALAPASSAIGAGDPSASTCPSTDERGDARSGRCDVGAYQHAAAQLAWNTSESPSTWYPSSASVPALAVEVTAVGPGVDHIACTGGAIAGSLTLPAAGGTVSPSAFANGTNTITCTPYDGATITGAAITRTILVDATQPTVTLSGPNETTWYRTTQTVTAHAAPVTNPSGVQSVGCTVDGTPGTTTTGTSATQTVSATGVHTVTCQALSGAGVQGTAASTTVNIDAQQPTVTQTVVRAGASDPPGSVDVLVDAAETDPLSGVASSSCSLDGQAATVEPGASQTVSLSGGQHTLVCTATTVAGVTSSDSSRAYVVPTANWSQQSTATSAVVTLIGAQPTFVAVIASESCSVDGGTPQTSTSSRLDVIVNGAGSHQLACTITTTSHLTVEVNYTAQVGVTVPAPLTTSAPDPGRWYQTAQTIVLAIPTDNPAIASVVCTLAGTTTTYPVTGASVTVNVSAPGGDVSCVNVDGGDNSSAAVVFPVHIDDSTPTGYFAQTGPTQALAAVSDPGTSGIQSVTMQYQVASQPWVTIPGQYDASTRQTAVALPCTLGHAGARYALRAIAVNNAGATTVIDTMKDGAPATAAALAAPGATLTGGLYRGTAPPGSTTVLAQTLTVNYGQAVSLAANLTCASGGVDDQTATILLRAAKTVGQLTATTSSSGSFDVTLPAGPSRTITYTVEGISRTVRIRVRGELTVRATGAAGHRTLALTAAHATGRVAFELEQYRDQRWRRLGTPLLTNRLGRATVTLPAALIATPANELRVLVRTQPTWGYLPAATDA